MITRRTGNAAEKYARLKGKQVRIYYQDLRGTHRSLIGTITDVDGDNLWLENGLWRGCLDCAKCAYLYSQHNRGLELP